METENKLEEAQYFLNQMKENLHNPKVLGFNLSAFITAARSVTYFMQKEYADNPKFKDWYYGYKQEEMKKDSVCKFFHDLSTANVHTNSPKTNRKVNVSIIESISVSASTDDKAFRNIKVIEDSSKTIETKKINTTNPNTRNANLNSNVKIKMFFREKPEEDGILYVNFTYQR